MFDSEAASLKGDAQTKSLLLPAFILSVSDMKSRDLLGALISAQTPTEIRSPSQAFERNLRMKG